MVTVVVKGVTKKGKDRVKQHGSVWRVLQKDNKGILLQSVQDEYLKWLYPDFEIVEFC